MSNYDNINKYKQNKNFIYLFHNLFIESMQQDICERGKFSTPKKPGRQMAVLNRDE